MSVAIRIKEKIRNIPDFPKKGIIFRDITTLLNDSEGFSMVIDELVSRYENLDIDYVAGIEARGFILAGAVAYRLKKGFIPIRKAGKLPAETVSVEYELEYGTDKLEIHTDSFKKGDKVLILDDLLATGGTSLAAAQLVEKVGAEVVELGFIVNLPDVGGEQKIKGSSYSLYYLCEFEGE